ncbi:hypothetical protein [Marinirhabdus gelatinilytica]|uniref:Uncharacterized protein n=1 Tax=Marinirhabdus gelatinilytica TaxID=1703343 RepID=A0A370QIW9_9FLAO|nr:hypothetical protein [Marinirhabdus gelatinilytica]RDK88313.1 hypothetical protein C8D94_101183 [Marinirhabdus gelatinilytica]
MKIFIYILMALAAGLLVYNTTKIDFEAPLEGDSTVAVICVLAAACVIVLLWILIASRTIKKKMK